MQLPWRGGTSAAVLQLAAALSAAAALVALSAAPAAASTAYISNNPGENNSTSLLAALLDQSVNRIVFLENTNLSDPRWARYRGSGTTHINVTRNVTVTAVRKDIILDLAYLSNAVMLAPGIMMEFTDMTVSRGRCVFWPWTTWP